MDDKLRPKMEYFEGHEILVGMTDFQLKMSCSPCQYKGTKYMVTYLVY